MRAQGSQRRAGILDRSSQRKRIPIVRLRRPLNAEPPSLSALELGAWSFPGSWSLNLGALFAGAWNLGFVWDLGFGIWSFVLSPGPLVRGFVVSRPVQLT